MLNLTSTLIILSVGHVLRKTANRFLAVCSLLVAKSGLTGADHVARSQLDRYVLFLIQSVIIISYHYISLALLLNAESSVVINAL